MATEVNMSSLDDEEEMESVLWSRFPQDLVERVVEKLPKESLMKMRRVCQSWDHIICSTALLCPPSLADSLLLCTNVGGRPSHLVLKWINPRTGSWDMRLLSYYKFRGGDYPGHNLLENSRGELVASDGGVLCFAFPYSVQNIVLCNPLTKCWRKLPGLIPHKAVYTWRVAGMSFNQHTGHHIIVCAGFFSEERERGANKLKATQVYDSSTDSWSLYHQPTPVRGGIWSTSVNRVVFTDDYLYVLTSPSLGGQHFVQIFSMKKKTWVEISLEGSIDNRGSAYLITLQEEIYLVAEEEQMDTHYLSFWKLDTSNMEDLWRQSFKRRMFGASVKIMWHRVNRRKFDALAAMTRLPFQWHVWGCVVHRRKICFLFPSTNCKAEAYDIFIEHDMGTDSWRVMDVDTPTPNRNLCSFEPSYADVFSFPDGHSLVARG